MVNWNEPTADKNPMTILKPITSTNQLVQTPTTPALKTDDGQPIELRPEQILRATVVEGGLEKALLKMNQLHYRAQSAIELQAGQKLTLQVLQTQPTLEFRVINDPLGGRLGQLLPLMTRPYNWQHLINILQQHSSQAQLPQATPQVLSQLQQLLQPTGTLPPDMNVNVAKLAGQLQQLWQANNPAQTATDGTAARTTQSMQMLNKSTLAMATNSYATLIAEPTAHNLTQITPTTQGQQYTQFNKLLLNLQDQLNQLVKNPVKLPAAWQSETRTQLAEVLQQAASMPKLTITQQTDLATLLGRFQQQTNLPQQLKPELAAILTRLFQQAAQSKPQTAQSGSNTSSTSGAPASNAGQQQTPTPASNIGQQQTAKATPQAPTGPPTSSTAHAQTIPTAATSSQPQTAPVTTATMENSAELAQGVEKLTAEVQQLQTQKGGLAPELVGRLEGLLDKLQQLPQQTATAPVLPGLELITAQLAQLIQQTTLSPKGGQLGYLSQLFGFNLEAELLNGKKKEALASLKMSLLTLHKHLADDGDEPLQRLEMLQLCKAKLADEQVQFLPLPFPELEEGYLTVERQREQDEELDPDAPLQLSISLRLSALGNMRVDMLYENDGLHLRVACEDKQRMRYLKKHTKELEEAIESVPVQGLSFSADAQVPAQQLLERLLPETFGMLDDRV